MINADTIEEHYADKYNTTVTSRKDIGDIYVDGQPVNIKSHNVNKKNYSPNLVSAYRAYHHLQDNEKELTFMFVYHNGEEIISDREVKVEHISWNCLSIQCQGNGVIQLSKPLEVDTTQTKEKWIEGLKTNYAQYIEKERKKLNRLEDMLYG
jgi:hypothetical protein